MPRCMDADSLMHCLVLQVEARLSRADCWRLLAAFPSTLDCLSADARCWQASGLSPPAVDALQRARDAAQRAAGSSLQRLRDQLAALDVRAVTVCDADYPLLLRSIDCPPPFLYLRGTRAALQRPQLAIVGSRRASPMGLRAARDFAEGAARSGLGVVSGLALGIDSAAHQGAIDAGGPTLAVMATGIDRVYPAKHRGLAHAVCETGCLLSEFAPGVPPQRDHFPRRNRLISGLAMGTLVVEAALPSGSLITANTALEQGREVFALPWSIYHANGRGCLQLLRDGAALVQTPRDIVDALGQLHRPDAAPSPRHLGAAELSPVARQIAALIDDAAVDADSLAAAAERTLPDVMSALAELEITGYVKRCSGGYMRGG